MVNLEHPIVANSAAVDAQGIMVFDNIHSMPVYNEAYTTPYYIVTLNLCGYIKGEYDLQPFEFHPQDLSILEPHHIVNAHEASADYHAVSFVLSPQMYDEMRSRMPSVYRDNFLFHGNAHVRLNNAQFEIVRQQLNVLAAVSRSPNCRRTDMIADALEVFFLLLQDFLDANGLETHHTSRREQLFSDFYEAIVEHYRESREVSFYANLFCLSPKHFATVIKQQTGITAHEWINRYVVIQAKSRLRLEEGKSIQQISDFLGFSDQGSFSRYFKNMTGLSPTEFRK